MNSLFTLLILFSFSIVYAGNSNNETLDYTIRFGPLKGGKASISTTHKEYKGKDMIFTEMKLQSTGVANSIYNFDNTYSCFIDSINCLPVKTSFNLSEQGDQYEDDVTYFQDEGTLFSNQVGWDEAKGEILDLVSLIYNFRFSGRLANLKKGDILNVPFWDVNEIYTLQLKFGGEEEIKTQAGAFQCKKIEPMSESGSGHSNKTPISIWITNDVRKLPVLIQFDLRIGSIKCELDSILQQR